MSVNTTRRVMLIAMADSVHVGRWLKTATADQNLEILLIPTSPHRKIHPIIRDMEKGNLPGVDLKIPLILRFLSLPIWILDQRFLLENRIRAYFIAKHLESFKPDFVHVMETQMGAYPFDLALQDLSNSSPIPAILTLFGSDLVWYAQDEYHRNKLVRVLPRFSLLATECQRDVQLARELGFEGEALPQQPVAGFEEYQNSGALLGLSAPSSRRKIAIKGYGGAWGLGHLAIEELGAMGSEIAKFEVVIFSAERLARIAAKRHLRAAGIRYKVHRKHQLTHKQMLDLFAESRIYIGLSKSDGLPASMLEAMSRGAFPIQTNSACIEGWFVQGQSGFSVSASSRSELHESISRSLRDASLVDTAKVVNSRILESNFRKSTPANSALTYEAISRMI